MKIDKSKLALAGFLSTGLLMHAQDTEDDEIFELSPFQVEAADNEGYRATTTLAGSRVRSNIKELGASIAVVTKDFLTDTGATDGESLLSYVGSIEVGGTQGNFSDYNGSDGSTNASRNNPQSGQRVRGLVEATTTRDYFQTLIPFDGYNTERVTVNRGPNSILFGLGSPGGVINNTTSSANIGGDKGEISLRFDHRGGHRASFNVNKTVIQDRLAIRVAGLKEEIKYKQDPAKEEDERLYFSFNSTLFQNENSDIFGATKLRGSFEHGEIFRNPPDVVPPLDGYSSWFNGIGSQEELNKILSVPGVDFSAIDSSAVTKEQVIAAVNGGFASVTPGMTLDEFATSEGTFVPKSGYDRFGGDESLQSGFSPIFLFPSINFNDPLAGTAPGWSDPELSEVQGIMGRWRRNGIPRGDLRWTSNPLGSVALRGLNFTAPSIQDRNIFDYHNNLFAGTTNDVMTEFDLYQAVLTQDLFHGKAGIEVAFDRQERYQSRFNAFSSNDSKQISIDYTTHQAPGDENHDGVADRLPNENFGRPVVRWNDNTTTQEWHDQDTMRATFFATLDSKDYTNNDLLSNILGSHTLTLLYEDKSNDYRNRQTRGSWWADSAAENPTDWPGGGNISNGLSDNFRRIVKTQVYLGDSAVGLTNPNQIRIPGGGINSQFPQIGDEYGIWYFDNQGSVDDGRINTWRVIENLQGADVRRDELTSDAFNLQSKFFGGNLIAGWARRHDKQESFQRLQSTQNYGDPDAFDDDGNPIVPLRLDLPGTNVIDGSFNERLLVLENSPASIAEDYTTTFSLVANYPENLLGELPFGMDLSAHYYEAESFQPSGISNNVLWEPLASPFGSTREKGITATLFDGRLSIRYNQYKTNNSNARTNLGGDLSNIVGDIGFFLRRIADAEDSGLEFDPSDADRALQVPDNVNRTTGTDGDLLGVSNYEEYYAKIISLLPAEVQELYNYRVSTVGTSKIVESNPFPGRLESTRDFIAKGTEIDIIGQVTKNLTISMNIAQQETVTSNTGPVAIPIMNQINENLTALGFAPLRDSPFQGETATYQGRYNQTIGTVSAEKAKDGTVSPELREWRVNMVARYDFSEGRFKGVSIGGAIRYQDEIAAGYPNTFDENGLVVPDLKNPFMGPDEMNGDLFIRYKTKFNDGKIDWTIQLNAKNLYRKNGDNDIPIAINPDGSTALIRIPNEKQFFLTNTFSF